MTPVDLDTTPYFVNSGKTVFVSSRDVKFDNVYEVRSPKSGVIKRFDFVGSVGAESGPDKVWLYKSDDGFHFGLCNGVRIDKQII